MTYGKRLRKALAGAGYSQSGLARAIGVKPQAIQHLCGETSQWSKHTNQIARVLGVSPQWLADGTGPERPASPLGDTDVKGGDTAQPILAWDSPDDLPENDYVLVQRVRVKPAAGEGTVVFEEEQGPPLAFSTRWIKRLGLKRKDLYVVEAQGDSMEPTIVDGDVIMMDAGSTRVIDGSIYVLRYADELKVKRLYQRYDGSLIIRSDNANKYPEETVPPSTGNQVDVLGRVVWRAGGIG